MRLLLAAVLLAAGPASAQLGGLMKKAAEKAEKKGILKEGQGESIVKTAKAFKRSSDEISESEEYYIGRAVAAELLGKYEPHPDPMLQGYVQAVGEVAAMASSRPELYGGWHFLVLQSEEPNALAAPGGFIFVTTGLLKLASSEDELAAVLAHEVAHVAEKHGLKTIKKSRLTNAFKTLAVEAGKTYGPEELKELSGALDGVVGDIVGSLVTKGYSREAEHEADKVGARTAAAAGYAPDGMVGVLKKLGEAKGGLGWLKTHPSPEDRLAELRKEPAAAAAWHKPPKTRQARFSKIAAKL